MGAFVFAMIVKQIYKNFEYCTLVHLKYTECSIS